MGRDRGVYNMPGNIELSKEAPLDARRKVNTYAELFLEATWKDSNNRVWLYDGMTVEVGDRLGELWQLKSKTSYKNTNDWIKISGGIEEAPKDGNPYMRKNGAWNAYTQIEEVYTFVADINEGKITQDAYNGLKAAVKAGKIIAIKLVDIDGRWIVSLSSLLEDTINLIVYAGDAFQILDIKSDLTVVEVNKNFILRNNTIAYDVTGDYNPAHKKYVDTAVSGVNTAVNNVKNNVLLKNNTTSYTPTQNYHPATKKYADNSSLYKVYNLDLNVADKTGVLLLWEAEKDEYNATVYRGIMMGSLCTIPLNGITQAGDVPLVSMFASFRKIGENNETNFMYARGSSYIRVAPATVIYNNKDYTALQIEVSGEADIMNFAGYFDRPPLLTWVPYLEETGSGTVILNEEINSNIDVSAAKELVYSSDVDAAIYGKIINADSGIISNDLIANGTNLTGIDAEERIMRYFGNLANFRNVVQDIVENHTRYFIHNGNNCRELGCLNVWKNTENTEHELHFILTGFGNGNLYTKRYSIRITENTDDARFIIENYR